jgi:tight adherence protein C
MWTYLILALIFLFAFAFVMWVSSIMAARRRKIEQRLQSQRSDPLLGVDVTPTSTPELVLGESMTPALAGTVPMDTENRSALQRELRAAGYYKPTALMEYAAIRACLIILPVVAAGALALFTDSARDAVITWGVGIVLAILGFSLPRVYLYFKAKSRHHQIERGLPVAIDMLTLCLSAGLNILNSLERVTSELRFAYPVLGEEFEIVRRQAELRSLDFALIQFAERVNMPQIRNLQVLLTQSENLGTDAVTVLREYADDLRVNMRQRADEMANKAPFKLLFPAYMMAFGAGILLISPAILEFQNFRAKNVIGTEIGQAKNFLENEDMKLRDMTPQVPEDPDYPGFPREWYRKNGDKPSKAELEKQRLEPIDETDEAKAAAEAKKKKQNKNLPSFAPRGGNQ